MAENFKDFMTKPRPRKDSSQAMLFGVGGGYMVYLAMDMILAAYRGDFDVSLKTAWITTILMLAAGVFVLAYAMRLWFAHKRALAAENARLQEAREAAGTDEPTE